MKRAGRDIVDIHAMAEKYAGKPEWCALCGKTTPWEDLIRFEGPWCCTVCVQKEHQRTRKHRLATATASMKAIGCPEMFADCSYDTWQGGWPKSLNRWARGIEPRSVFLWGETGSGKTHLATALMRDWLVERAPALWIRAAHFIAKVHVDRKLGTRFMDDSAYQPLLLLDEVMIDALSDWAGETLREIISRRYDAKRPTIITTNNDPDVWAAWDMRIARRVSEGVVLHVRRLVP